MENILCSQILDMSYILCMFGWEIIKMYLLTNKNHPLKKIRVINPLRTPYICMYVLKLLKEQLLTIIQNRIIGAWLYIIYETCQQVYIGNIIIYTGKIGWHMQGKWLHVLVHKNKYNPLVVYTLRRFIQRRELCNTVP